MFIFPPSGHDWSRVSCVVCVYPQPGWFLPRSHSADDIGQHEEEEEEEAEAEGGGGVKQKHR